MARRKKGRPVSGIVLLDKPSGDSSNRALQRVKRLFDAQKAGHTGSLDPMATGVLPVCLGEATKFSQYLLDSNKSYKATIQLGVQTTTGDIEGEVLFETTASQLTAEQVQAVLHRFTGTVEQTPPMYSAIKIDGQPLYKLARQGITVERKKRQIHIYRLVMDDFRPGQQPQLDISVDCSKGTYIRTLAEDIASALGDIGGHLVMLQRSRVGEFDLADTVSIEHLQELRDNENWSALDALLIPAEQAVNHLPAVEVSSNVGYYLRQGQAVLVPHAPCTGLVRIRQENGDFLGVGEILDDGRVAPRRLVVSA